MVICTIQVLRLAFVLIGPFLIAIQTTKLQDIVSRFYNFCSRFGNYFKAYLALYFFCSGWVFMVAHKNPACQQIEDNLHL